MFIRNKEGRVPVTVHLEDIAGKLEETMDHWEQYLNVVTGVFEALPDGMYIEADEELVERIEGSTDYVRLPNQYEIHERLVGSEMCIRDSSRVIRAKN